MKKKTGLLFIILILMLTISCKPKLYVDFDPPSSLDSGLFPASIEGKDAKISEDPQPEGFSGYVAVYGDNDMLIRVVKASSAEEADNYFKSYLVPYYDKLPTNHRVRENDKFVAEGIDIHETHWNSWVNKNWIFTISGKTEADLKSAIEAFEYCEFGL